MSVPNLKSTPAQKPKQGAKRGVAFSPPSAEKATKKSKAGGDADGRDEGTSQRQGDSTGAGASESMDETVAEVLNVSDIHETVLSHVKETLSAFTSQEGSDSSLRQLVPVLATALTTAVSVAVTEAMKGAVRAITDSLSATPPPQQPSAARVNRLQAAVTRLTYENDRLQQYSRRESVRIQGVKQEEGETADQAEKKALAVFEAIGASVRQDDIAVAHRAGRAHGGSRAILVKFVSRRTKRRVMEMKKELRNKGSAFEKTYINDDLTPLRARLLGFIKRQRFTDKAWTAEGRICCLVRTGAGTQPKPIVIESPDDLFDKLGMELTASDFRDLGLTHLVDVDED